MEVLLVRHGIAESEMAALRGGRRDEERRLTAEGIRETEAVAAALRARVGNIDRIFHSPFARARETAEILAKKFGEAAVEQVSGFTPESDPREPAEFLAGLPALSRVMIVSHEPFLSAALSYMLTGGFRFASGFERAGVASVEWGGAGSSRLNFFAPPPVLLGGQAI
jgi:phosphohistidine phosphatase